MRSLCVLNAPSAQETGAVRRPGLLPSVLFLPWLLPSLLSSDRCFLPCPDGFQIGGVVIDIVAGGRCPFLRVKGCFKACMVPRRTAVGNQLLEIQRSSTQTDPRGLRRPGRAPAVRTWRDRLVLTGWGFHLPAPPSAKAPAPPAPPPSRLRPVPPSSVAYTQRRPPCSPALGEHTGLTPADPMCGIGKGERESSGGHGRAAPTDAGERTR